MNVLELFAGVGGLSLGFKQADFNIVGAIELDESIAKSFQKNKPETKVFIGDICNILPTDVEKSINCKVDIIIGGPPCQGFSTRGKNLGKDDERNFLFKEFFKYVEYFSPKYFLIENVANFITLCDGYFLNEVKRFSKEFGYMLDFKVLNSKYFDVPQMRKRAFILGAKSKKITLPMENFNTQIPTVWEAISDLDYLNSNEGEFESDYLKPPLTDYQRDLRKDSKKLYNHKASNHSKIAIERLMLIPPEKGKEYLPKKHLTKSTFGGTWGRLEKESISPTIVTRFDTPSNGKNSHPFLHRSITPREAARIQSFPDDFIFYGKKTSIIKQIGNAVPPKLAYAIALKIKEEDKRR